VHEEPRAPGEEAVVEPCPPEPAADGPSDGPAPPDPLAELGRELAELGRELAGLRAEIGRAHDRAAAREQIIDRLHEENQRLRAGERRLLLRPLLTDLQRLRHDILRTADGLPATFDAEAARGLLRSYAASLELSLERGGVNVMVPALGAAFDPSTQRATGTVPATDPEQEATVAEVVLDGYHDVETGRTVVPAAVRIHRWVPDPRPVTEDGPEDPAEVGPVDGPTTTAVPEPAATSQPTPIP
jgi:molecular chaperone GrpE (heat shock protein)